MPAKLKSPVEDIDPRSVLREDLSLLTANLTAVRKLSGGPRGGDFRREAKALIEEATAGKADSSLLTRAGIAAYLTGRHETAVELLSRVPQDAAAQYYRGLAAMSLERLVDAENAFAEAEAAGFDKPAAAFKRAEAIRRQGRLEDAEKLVRSMGKVAAGRAEYSFQMGCVLSDRDDLDGSLEYFERAADIDPYHAQTLFRLGNIAATRGDDAEAIRFYERSLSSPPLHMGALLNLGLLYEDIEQYRAAAYCFRRVLEVNPNNARARLYLRDIEATDNMYYDEDSDRATAKREQQLARPLSDFELSVRSRNCLQMMNMHTLGDLTKVTEQDLLAGKNFGETSLEEVRDLMASQGMRIGEALEEYRVPREATAPVQSLSPREQQLLDQPISALELSVRSRKCMSRLGIATIGELVNRTPDELLGTRNFGVTSLNEIRARLADRNLKLRND